MKSLAFPPLALPLAAIHSALTTLLRSQIFCGDKTFDDVARIDLPNPLKIQLMDAAVVNTMSKTNLAPGGVLGIPTYTGNDTECGLLVMANTIGTGGGTIDYAGDDMPYKDIRRRYPEEQAGRKQFTFSSARKRMSTRVMLPNGKYRIFCKGAAEMVVDLCTKKVTAHGEVEALTTATKADIMKVISGFADEALRTICIAYKDTEHEVESVEEAEDNLVMVIPQPQSLGPTSSGPKGPGASSHASHDVRCVEEYTYSCPMCTPLHAVTARQTRRLFAALAFRPDMTAAPLLSRTALFCLVSLISVVTPLSRTARPRRDRGPCAIRGPTGDCGLPQGRDCREDGDG